jgi:small neutral amino acid transporter SnatA (MarC family)
LGVDDSSAVRISMGAFRVAGGGVILLAGLKMLAGKLGRNARRLETGSRRRARNCGRSCRSVRP